MPGRAKMADWALRLAEEEAAALRVRMSVRMRFVPLVLLSSSCVRSPAVVEAELAEARRCSAEGARFALRLLEGVVRSMAEEVVEAREGRVRSMLVEEEAPRALGMKVCGMLEVVQAVSFLLVAVALVWMKRLALTDWIRV